MPGPAYAKKYAKQQTSHYAGKATKGRPVDDEAFKRAMAAAPDERSRQEVRRMREVIAAASKRKLAV